MKVKINCPKCGSDNIKITSDGTNAVPMYKCNKCTYTHRLFPEFEAAPDKLTEDLDEQ